ncbi:Polypyrimidine tract-binding protein-like protein 3 [Bienertia sinuspersici]
MSEPSKVIHVRNVGHEISENDLLQLFQPFGVITKLVMLRAKNQALVQMQDVPSAVSVLQYYTNTQPSIRCVDEEPAFFTISNVVYRVLEYSFCMYLCG